MIIVSLLRLRFAFQRLFSHIHNKFHWRQVTILLVVMVIALFISAAYLHFAKGYIWADWTGFGSYTGTLTPDQRGKTLWNWLELLIVPIALTIGAFWLERRNRITEAQRTEERIRVEREIAADARREEMLRKYFDVVSKLLVEHNLRQCKSGAEECIVVRAYTLATLGTLNGERKGLLLLFLYEAGLIRKDTPIVDLSGADLRGIVLQEKSLKGIVLKEVLMEEAKLIACDLEGADLSGSRITDANLDWSNLNNANLEDVSLKRSSIKRAKLMRAKMRHANLRWTSFFWSDMDCADLRDTILGNTNFKKASLIEADFRDASELNMPDEVVNALYGALTRQTDEEMRILDCIDFTEANLQRANFENANLLKINAFMTNLTETLISEEQLKRKVEIF